MVKRQGGHAFPGRVAQGQFLKSCGFRSEPRGASSLPSPRFMLILTLVTALTKTARTGFWMTDAPHCQAVGRGEHPEEGMRV